MSKDKIVELTVSNKYQVVIPKNARRQLGIMPGQKLVFAGINKDGSFSFAKRPSAADIVQKYRGSMAGAWGDDDPAKVIRQMRDSEWPK